MTATSQKSSRGDLAASHPARMKELLVDLANLRDDGLTRFRKKWKSLLQFYRGEDVLARRDELRLLWTVELWTYRIKQEPHRSFHQWRDSLPADFAVPLTEHNRSLYDEWVEIGEGLLGPLEQHICNHWLILKGVRFEVEWSENRKAVVATGRTLPPNLVRACVQVAKRFGYCRNLQCAAPYFLASRRDQLYCSSDCAWPAKKAAKLKWWHAHRGKSAARAKPRRTRRRR